MGMQVHEPWQRNETASVEHLRAWQVQSRADLGNEPVADKQGGGVSASHAGVLDQPALTAAHRFSSVEISLPGRSLPGRPPPDSPPSSR